MKQPSIIDEFRELAQEVTRPLRAADRALTQAMSWVASPLIHAEMIEHVGRMPQGKALLQEARDNKVPISFFYKQDGRRDGFYGGPFKRPPAIGVRNTMRPGGMGSMLYHELWHMHQYSEMGDRPRTFSLTQAKTSLFYTLIIEADAYTQQGLAMHGKKGSGMGIEDLIGGTKGNEAIKDFLKNNPASGFADSAEMGRAYFVHYLPHLVDYRAGAYIEMMQMLDFPATRGDFLRQQSELPEAKLIAPTQSLKDNYGTDYTGQLDMRALRSQVLRSLPMEERKFMQMAEDIGRNTHKMTDAQFNAAREAIRPQLQKALDQVGIISSTAPDFKRVQQQRDALGFVARQKLPPTTADLRGHVAKIAGGSGQSAGFARTPPVASRPPTTPKR